MFIFSLKKSDFSKYEFAIRKTTNNNGQSTYEPIARRKDIFRYANWIRITKIENKLFLMDIDFDPSLNMDECKERIEEYKLFLKDKENSSVKEIQIIKV